MQESSGGVVPQVENVSEHEIRDGAALDADISLFHYFLKLREVSEMEAMAYSLSSKDDSIVELLVVS